MVLPNDERVTSSKCYSLSFKIGNVNVEHQFYVLDINSDLIVGSDFLRRFEVFLDYADMTAVLNVDGTVVPVPVMSQAYEIKDVLTNLNKISL